MAQDPPQPPKQRTRKPSATRLLKGAIAAGLTVRGVELDSTGTLRVLVGDPGKPSNDLDNWLKKKDAHQA
jgi:hypothetical protein